MQFSGFLAVPEYQFTFILVLKLCQTTVLLKSGKGIFKNPHKLFWIITGCYILFMITNNCNCIIPILCYVR